MGYYCPNCGADASDEDGLYHHIRDEHDDQTELLQGILTQLAMIKQNTHGKA